MQDTFFQFLFSGQSSYFVQKGLIFLIFSERCTRRSRRHVGIQMNEHDAYQISPWKDL